MHSGYHLHLLTSDSHWDLQVVGKDNRNINSSLNNAFHKSKSILVHIIETSLIKGNGMEERVCKLLKGSSLMKENSG